MIISILNFRLSLLVLIFISNLSYAVCEKATDYYTTSQSIFSYAGNQGEKFYLIDLWGGGYLAFFQDESMTLEKMDHEFDGFVHSNRFIAPFWVDSFVPTRLHLNGEQIDIDTHLNLSISSTEMIIFLGRFPQYGIVFENGAVEIKNWPIFNIVGTYFLGGYFVGGTFVVLIVHDEKVNFYRSSDGYIWDKSDFSVPSYVRGYTHNNLFWVVDEQAEKYSSEDGLDWQMNMDDHSFNQYEAEYDTHRARLLTKLRESNYIVNSIDGDHNEGVVVGSCYKRVGPKIENMGFLLRYKNNQYTMYEDFDNKKPLTFVGKSWELGSE